MMRAVAVQGRRIGQAVAQKRMIRPVFLPAATAANAIRSMSSQVDQAGGTILSNMAADNPHVDVVRYHHKNRTWTLQHVNYYAEALAIGLLENGLKPGDAVLSWLPSHLSEQVRTVPSCFFNLKEIETTLLHLVVRQYFRIPNQGCRPHRHQSKTPFVIKTLD